METHPAPTTVESDLQHERKAEGREKELNWGRVWSTSACRLIRQPVIFYRTSPAGRAGDLNVPVPVAQRVQPQLGCDFSHTVALGRSS